jgi:FAD/FMN-containing dehydrogenase
MWRDYFGFVTGTLGIGRDPFDAAHPLYVLVETMGMEPERDREVLTEALAGFMDANPGVDAVLASSLADADGLWSVRDASGEATRALGRAAGFDVSLPIEEMERWVAEVHAALRGIGLSHFHTFGHAADGNLHLNVAYPGDQPEYRGRIEDIVYRSIGALRGSVSAEHGVGFEKKSYLALSRSPAEIALMRTLKAAIDPHGLLNAGRIFDA